MTSRCQKCCFALVYKESIDRYKCSKCGTTYLPQEVESMEFRKSNELLKNELEQQVCAEEKRTANTLKAEVEGLIQTRIRENKNNLVGVVNYPFVPPALSRRVNVTLSSTAHRVIEMYKFENNLVTKEQAIESIILGMGELLYNKKEEPDKIAPES